MSNCCLTGYWAGTAPAENAQLTINNAPGADQPATPTRLNDFLYVVGSQGMKVAGGVIFDATAAAGIAASFIPGVVSSVATGAWIAAAAGFTTVMVSTAVSSIEMSRFNYSNSEILTHVGKSALTLVLPFCLFNDIGMPPTETSSV